MELLAPAGTIEVFENAINAGADAVYIGAPWLNARALAKHFTLAEIAAMIDHGHKAGVKVYLAMNSLMKEDEVDRALELLAVFSSLKADALIIQDLGIYYLAKRFFPELRIHASTLLTAHNSLAALHFARMGFSRVVLARELTLSEISSIHQKTGVELEAFVHGAMCFSYSGLCLFSSFLGGKSGLRGRCVQPCRRKYAWTGKGRSKQSRGYFFSMNDMCGIDLLPQLKEAGVSSLKIEGRMRSSNYVMSVVKAYRIMLDALPGDEVSREHAFELLQGAMGRKTTQGYFVSPDPQDILSPEHSGNIGLFVGKIKEVKGGKAVFVLATPVKVGDRLRVHHEKTGERESFTIKEFFVDNKPATEARDGDLVSVKTPFEIHTGDFLYRVDTAGSQTAKTIAGHGQRGRYQRIVSRLDIQDRISSVKRALASFGGVPWKRKIKEKDRIYKHRSFKRKKVQSVPLELWCKVDDLRLIRRQMPLPIERYVVSLDQQTYRQLMKMGKALPSFARNMTLSLPPIILEQDIPFYQRAVSDLLAKNCYTWQLGHISQIQFFHHDHQPHALDSTFSGGKRATAGKEKTRPGPKGINKGGRLKIIGDYTVNAMNSLAFMSLKESAFVQSQISIETDRQNLRNILAAGPILDVGLTVFGRPPLFISRASVDYFNYDRPFVSPRGERFVLKKAWGQTIAVSSRTFSLLPWLEELSGSGVRFAVIDLCHLSLTPKNLSGVLKQLTSKRKSKNDSTFNYFLTLH